jgi:hypothetical protein
LISKNDNEIIEFRKLKDLIKLNNLKYKTILKFSDFQKAKRINNQSILSQKDAVYWGTKIISIQKNILKIIFLKPTNDLKRIDSLTEIKSKLIDSSNYLIKPSKKELKTILRLKKIGTSAIYSKVQQLSVTNAQLQVLQKLSISFLITLIW